MSKLTFDAEAHVYRWGGEIVPSVTQVLGQVMNWSAVPEDLLEAGRARGTAVHALTEAVDRGEDVDWLVTAGLAPYLDAYRCFLSDTQVRWSGIEERVFHPLHRYAGTYDRCGFIGGSDETAWLDIKTGSPHPAHALQLSAYAEADPMLPRGYAEPHRYCLYLRNDGTYRLVRIRSRHVDDFAVFLSLLTAARWKEKNHV